MSDPITLQTPGQYYTWQGRIATFFLRAYNCFMLTVSDLQAYITTHNIPAELVFPLTATPTVEDAARAMGVHPDKIIKSVLFIIRRLKPLLVIANGVRHIDQRAIASRLGVGKKQVKIAKPDEVLTWTGFPAGGVPGQQSQGLLVLAAFPLSVTCRCSPPGLIQAYWSRG